jgi:hypothetical protein
MPVKLDLIRNTTPVMLELLTNLRQQRMEETLKQKKMKWSIERFKFEIWWNNNKADNTNM